MNTTNALPLHTTHGTMRRAYLGMWHSQEILRNGAQGDCFALPSYSHDILGTYVAGPGAVVTDEMVALPSPLREGLTTDSLALFIEFAEDACNYSGTPEVGGNVHMNAARRGNLTDLKKHGLVRTFVDGNLAWIEFTARGHAYAKFLGLDTSSFDYVLSGRV